MTSVDTTTSRAQALAELRDGERFLLITHENPDGDAIGSLVAMQGTLAALQKDSLMYLAASEFPLPYEYRFFALEGLVTEAPADIEDRTIVFLDCGNSDRSPFDTSWPGAHVVNIDHHHDNTRFGSVNHVDGGASCTAEMVWDLMAGLGVRPTRQIAEALYVGLVTDTGRFMYENTGRVAHLMAVDLMDRGIDVHAIYRRLYEGMPYSKLELLSRALRATRQVDDGRLMLTFLRTADFDETGAEESHSEGIIDHLRSVEGTEVAAVVRDRAAGTRKVSLRATGDDVDVSVVARAGGGGGHRRAAGFATELDDDALVEFLRSQVDAQLQQV